MPKNLFKEKKNESLLNKGINIIIQAFNDQKNEYSQNPYFIPCHLPYDGKL